MLESNLLLYYYFEYYTNGVFELIVLLERPSMVVGLYIIQLFILLYELGIIKIVF